MIAVEPEFSRPFEVGRVAQASHALALSATAEECAALARRFELPAIESLSADLSLFWAGGRRELVVEGRLRAKVTQTCVVTLEPLPAEVDAPFRLLYTPEPLAGDAGDAVEVEFDPEAEDPPEPIVDGVIDLGEAVAEQLALALDPYPRRADAAVPAAYAAEEDARENPFAVLRERMRPN